MSQIGVRVSNSSSLSFIWAKEKLLSHVFQIGTFASKLKSFAKNHHFLHQLRQYAIRVVALK